MGDGRFRHATVVGDILLASSRFDVLLVEPISVLVPRLTPDVVAVEPP
jgi:hypothetical protein